MKSWPLWPITSRKIRFKMSASSVQSGGNILTRMTTLLPNFSRPIKRRERGAKSSSWCASRFFRLPSWTTSQARQKFSVPATRNWTRCECYSTTCTKIFWLLPNSSSASYLRKRCTTNSRKRSNTSSKPRKRSQQSSRLPRPLTLARTRQAQLQESTP